MPTPEKTYAAVLTYFVNGACIIADPTSYPHWSFSRKDAVDKAVVELRKQEPALAGEGAKLLRNNDVVRVGRIHVAIRTTRKDYSTEGCESLPQEEPPEYIRQR